MALLQNLVSSYSLYLPLDLSCALPPQQGPSQSEPLHLPSNASTSNSDDSNISMVRFVRPETAGSSQSQFRNYCPPVSAVSPEVSSLMLPLSSPQRGRTVVMPVQNRESSDDATKGYLGAAALHHLEGYHDVQTP
ncbi:hypothetical protein CY34DRAFT_17302 [Suillus luteus UH-Slu-Lm8-n1]|uniref:Uncharacterized protein n=1 Tax=Suillus luteus UH-Slu-Lm8-n1 TaxID=930992 RepID=A0A0D0ALB3_9AGAM|nr:hypothetical protein CY34DRAFT_17302 [Suillus luteus UH-Slu-Lm8-n1]